MKIITTMLIALIVSQTNSVLAASCEQTIEGNDMLQFNLKEIVMSSTCSEVTINLKHTGQLDGNIMGHNWVLSKTEDFMPLALAGGQAGPSENYVPSNDSRIIASTVIIGGGEATSVTFSLASLGVGEDYTFFCSFPGHYAIMKGVFRIIN